eukprot:maker-scaffold210_size256293-snap-gene-1.22 protein:Tk03089 transcript:maker-scaffold210_size256293-snap-gene-1.22-mRNA-1 annotation:"protein fam151a-like isoform x1"
MTHPQDLRYTVETVPIDPIELPMLTPEFLTELPVEELQAHGELAKTLRISALRVETVPIDPIELPMLTPEFLTELPVEELQAHGELAKTLRISALRGWEVKLGGLRFRLCALGVRLGDQQNFLLNQRVGLVRRLLKWIPQCHIQPIVDGLVMSKLRYGLPVFGQVRLQDTDPTHGNMKKLQGVLNDLMRLVANKRISDKVSCVDLSEMTGIPSLNRICASATLKELKRASDLGWPLADVLEPAKTCYGMGLRSQTSKLARLPGPSTRKGLDIRTMATLWNQGVEEGRMKNSKIVQIRVGLVRRLLKWIPRCQIQPIVDGLVISKLRYGLPVFGQVQLQDTDPTHGNMKKLQGVLNDLMRLVANRRTSDKISCVDLSEMTGIPSLNRICASATLKELKRASDLGWPLADVLEPAKTCYGMGLRSQTSKLAQITDLWPEVEGNLTRVTWSHATNSIEKLDQAINGDVMMIEADVNMGYVEGDLDHLRPIMAHPPAFISDLSLEDFLNRVIDARNAGQKKGVKLDFKSTTVLEESFKVLPDFKEQINFPLWLNGDILYGPGTLLKAGSPRVVDPAPLIALTKEHFPTATISPGWVTSSLALDGNDFYTEGQISEMIQTLASNEVGTLKVTFPVRSKFMAKSEEVFATLLEASLDQSGTLTMWGTDDIPDIAALRGVMDSLGRSRIYMDLPEDLADQLG